MKNEDLLEKYDIARCCAYCEKATVLAEDDYILCSKKGVVSTGYACRRFAYDPLKRVPKRPAALPTLDIELPEV